MLHSLEIMSIAAGAGFICTHGAFRTFYHEGHEQFVIETEGDEYLLSANHDNSIDAVYFANEISETDDEYISMLISDGVFF